MLKTLFVTVALLISTTAIAIDKILLNEVRSQIEDYYLASGQYQVIKISNFEEIDIESMEFSLYAADTLVKNYYDSRILSEVCLISFVKEDDRFLSINCF
jgi:hypothetical protein